MDAQATRAVRSVVVFADNRIPDTAATPPSAAAPIRRYLDAGGKVVVLGANPLAYRADPSTGAVETVDYAVPAAMFDVAFAEAQVVNGYYGYRPTPTGIEWGLAATAGVGFAGVLPQPGVEILAADEFGRASVWTRSYGGPSGTGLLQLSTPRQQAVDFGDLLAVIERGVRW